MIKFDNLEKVCNELGLKVENSYGYTNVFNKDNILFISLNPFKAWDCNFNLTFSYLEPSIKAMLIKAMARDYEEHLNGND